MSQLSVIEHEELSCLAKSCGAMESAIEIIARGDWRKKEMVALARRTIALVKTFETQKEAAKQCS